MLLDFNKFRYAIVTSTTYGTWLPGSNRGFVCNVIDAAGNREIHNDYGTPCDADLPGLLMYAKSQMKSETIIFNIEQAETILAQWHKETAKLHWHLFVVAIMNNHFHLVVAAPSEIDKEDFLRTFKSRASFALNKKYGKQTWWTTSGSVQYSFDEQAHRARIEYVRNQKNKLLLWENPQEFIG
jgi:REP element-mobilizing transposase RayT